MENSKSGFRRLKKGRTKGRKGRQGKKEGVYTLLCTLVLFFLDLRQWHVVIATPSIPSLSKHEDAALFGMGAEERSC